MDKGSFEKYLESLDKTENNPTPNISFASLLDAVKKSKKSKAADASNLCDYTKDFKAELRRISKQQKEKKPTKAKTDLTKSGSEWSVDMFKKYEWSLKIYDNLHLRKSAEMGKIPKQIKDSYKGLMEVFEDDPTEPNPANLGEPLMRVFIDAFMIPIARRHRVILRSEVQLYTQSKGKHYDLPNSRADYVIFTRGGKVLGCIEAKDKGGLIQKSIVQCILQLISLREAASNTLFNIITDGFNFIFMKYMKNGDLKLDVTSNGECKIHTIQEEWGNVQDIAAIVDALIEDGRNEITPDTDFLADQLEINLGI